MIKEKLLKTYQFIFCRKIFIPLNIHLYKIVLRGIGVLNSGSPKETGEEYFLKEIVAKSKPNLILEVGANDGGYCKQILSCCPKARIYAFEPHPVTFEKLKKQTLKMKNIKLFRLGFSNKEGYANLWDFSYDSELKHKQPTSTLASLSRDVIEKLHKQKSMRYKISLSTLDNFCRQYKIKTIDFLKIDTEGSEFRVLQGARQMLTNNKIKIILFEFNEMNVYSRVFLRDFIDILSNYNIFRLMPSGLLPINHYQPKLHEIFAYQNIIAINKNIRN